MTELYINDQRVFFDDSKKIKITVENQYFTNAGNYSLEIAIPTTIYRNRKIFGNINRMEVGKDNNQMSARLVLNNKTLINGSAKITKITKDTISIQLSGRMNGDKFFTEHGDKYIDEIKLGSCPFDKDEWSKSYYYYIPGIIGEYIYMPVYDETNGVIYNRIVCKVDDETNTFYYWIWNERCAMPNLHHVIKRVIASCGYTIVQNDIDRIWQHLYIANAHIIEDISEALPHWTISDFITEVKNFFNCSMLFDADRREVRIMRNNTFFDNGIQEFPVVDEYVAEIKKAEDSEKALSYSNIRFDLSDSPSHKYQRLSDELLKKFQIKEFASHDGTLKYVNSLSDKDKKSYLYKDETGIYVWGVVYIWKTETWALRRVNEFGELTRKKDEDNYIDLKICPVGITWDQVMEYRGPDARNKLIGSCNVPMLSMANPFGLQEDGPFMGNRNKDKSCVWDIINGDEDMPEEISAEDRLQVFFLDTYIQRLKIENFPITKYPMPFTDCGKDILVTEVTDNRHSPWSLSLNKRFGVKTLGDLHENKYIINTEIEVQIDFYVTEIPDIDKVFIFNNKRYVCRKFEYTLQDNRLDPIIRGYFYEMAAS